MDISFSGGDFDLAATQSMNRSVLLAGALCIPVVYALVHGDFVVILMSVVAGYVIHTLLGKVRRIKNGGNIPVWSRPKKSFS